MTAPRPQRFDLAVPGECHPWYLDRYDEIVDADLDVFAFPVFSHPSSALLTDDPPLSEQTVTQLHLQRRKVAQSLEPRYGGYVWNVWVDDLGRQVADREAEYVEASDRFALPTYNPGRTWRWVYGCWVPDRRVVNLPGLTI